MYLWWAEEVPERVVTLRQMTDPDYERWHKDGEDGMDRNTSGKRGFSQLCVRVCAGQERKRSKRLCIYFNMHHTHIYK